jgi:predicted metalloprotease with PDZ domain
MTTLLALALTALTAASQAPVRYRLELAKPGDTQVSVRLTLPGDPSGPVVLVMPRAVPMGYSQQPYDRYLSDVSARGPDDAPVAVAREDGPRWRVGATGGRIHHVEYRVDLARMEREITSASDSSMARSGYAGLLGYSVFGYVDGLENRPAQLEVVAPLGWPVFTTLAPTTPPAVGRAEGNAESFYALADSQVAMGPDLQVKRLESPVPLYVAAYAEGKTDLDLTGRLLREAMEALVAYFGEAPFAHYSALVELLKPLSADHEYGFSMEHLSSSHYFLSSKDGLSADSPPEAIRRVRFNFTHHVAHAWIPKRACGEGYFPFSWELAPVIDTIWLSEGFARYIAIDALADTMPETEGVAYRGAMLGSLRRTLDDMPGFIRTMPLVALSRIASTRYSEDFRTGRTLFARGALLAAELDARIRERSGGRKRARDAFRHLVAWSLKSGRAFRIDELPGLFREATGVDTGDVWDRWLRPHAP